jgi:hypothetical protein
LLRVRIGAKHSDGRKPSATRQSPPTRLADMMTMVMVRRVRGAISVGAAAAVGLAPA